ncbi:hypothetical protein [Fusobacterium sp. SYSU M8D902]|uniref:hypothetical protein n=1 Tax=Fusobacterium sp. SYSU M8D902 TaxID=3159562 RepID=UPI0032E3C3D4
MIIKIAGIVYIMLSTYNTIISLINEKDYVIETWQEDKMEFGLNLLIIIILLLFSPIVYSINTLKNEYGGKD